MLELKPILEAGVAAGHAPGFSAAIVTRQGGPQWATAGALGADTADPVTNDTLFWIASCTKAVTSVAALQLVERGLLDLDAPVGDMLPTLRAPSVLAGFGEDGSPILRPAAGSITLRHLLTHTSGLAYDFCSANLNRYLTASGRSLMGDPSPDIPLLFDPGERWQYGIGIDWAGRLIEAVTGQGLDAYVAQNILAPLGMCDTTFFPSAGPDESKAGVSQRQDDNTFVAIPFAMPSSPHFMMGGGGLYSTPRDYLKFLAAILAGGEPLIGAETFSAMMANQVGDFDAGVLLTAQPGLSHDFTPLPGVRRRWGLAGLTNMDDVPAGRSAGSLAWAGLANCYYWADPASGAAGVVMAQVFPFADPGVLATFEAVERAVYS